MTNSFEDVKNNKPNKEALLEDLRRIGMKTFVEYYICFVDPYFSRQKIIEKMRSNENYKDTSLNTKVSAGLKIAKQNQAIDALRIISNSKMVECEIRNKALELLKQE
ncbi:hypothetical protein [Campylobacter sp. RM15925]|uniref:hypothetical protein n=1 Tax=Campylobacter sp. RM15925 TaxID=1705724 RepID=UPI001474AF29|nr:hypothetical protein [Campylobacter sp. RM15925]